jgi:thiamine pyrophosphate-dependent acetolactate synthase large subunit-like protein
MLDRRKFVTRLLSGRADLLVVASLGAPCWDVAAAGDCDLNFYVWGAMGSSSMVALGIAAAQPSWRVIAVVGDGDALMALGSFATIATARRTNLGILILDNERYGDTGNQPSHTSANVNLERIGAATGFAHTLVVTTEDQIIEARRLLMVEAGPNIVVAKVASEISPIVLPPRDGTFLKHRFRRALLGDANPCQQPEAAGRPASR